MTAARGSCDSRACRGRRSSSSNSRNEVSEGSLGAMWAETVGSEADKTGELDEVPESQ